MRIGEAARLAGISARSLRHYEDKGLLTPQRDELGYRTYTLVDVEAARGVRALIAAGLSTDEIARIAPCLSWEGGVSALCPRSVRALREKMERIDESIAALQVARSAIGRIVDSARPAGADLAAGDELAREIFPRTP